ncbi:MAG: hypothetical protein NT010_11880 [Proteobacteria bacterium]|nr:hypothetical protein [Pseudomonadota bacterium]
MTNKVSLIFFVAATVSTVFFMLMGTRFAVNITVQVLSVIANAFGLHEVPALSTWWYW